MSDMYQTINVEDAEPGHWNPRKHRNPKKQAELEASIKEHGIIHPILVRPPVAGEKGLFQIIAGEGRWLAARAIGLAEVPATVRPGLTDAQCTEIACVENLQRADLHALDEAESFASLQKVDRAYTVEVLAHKFSKPVSYVRRRLRLLELPKAIRSAFLADVITDAHAEKIAKLPAKLQEAAFLEGCFLEISGAAVKEAVKDERFDAIRNDLAAVSSLDAWIARRVKADLTDPDVQERLPELAELQANAAADGRKILEVSSSYHIDKAEEKRLGLAGVPNHNDYREVGTKTSDRCDSTVRAVVVHGGPTKLVDICADKQCRRHWPSYGASGDDEGGSSDPANKRKPTKWELEEEKRRKKAREYSMLKGAALRAMTPALVKTTSISTALAKNMVKSHTLKDIASKFGLGPDRNPIAVVIAAHILGEAWDRKRLLDVGKLIGFDLAKFERDTAKAKDAGKKKPRLVGKKKAAKAAAKK